MDTQHPTEKQFHVTVTRESEAIAKVSTHGISLQLSMKGTDPTLGFTAPETVIAGYGACVMTNFGKAASEFDVTIEDLHIDFFATNAIHEGFRAQFELSRK